MAQDREIPSLYMEQDEPEIRELRIETIFSQKTCASLPDTQKRFE